MSCGIELSARPDTHFVYSGTSLLISDRDGWVRGGMQGFYAENTRLLSRLELEVEGQPLQPVGVSPVGANRFLGHYLISQEGLSHTRPVFLSVRRVLGEGLRMGLRLTNYALRSSYTRELRLRCGADFADLSEAQKGERAQYAEVETVWDEERRELHFRYCHPELDRAVAVVVEASPVPVRFDEGALHFEIALEPHQTAEIQLVAEPIFDGKRRRAPRGNFGQVADRLERVRHELKEEAPRLTTTNPTVARAWRTAIEDLASLPLGLEEGPRLPAAGLPLYQQFFGRDSLTIAWQALPAMPSMMRDVLKVNAAYQGSKIDDWYDEEPGKLINRVNWGPLSQLGINPYRRFYGDYATPPDFLIMLGQYLGWTNDLATVRELLPAARAAIDWLDRYGDLDNDGFIEYVSRSEAGDAKREIKNQGWKDSYDAIVDEYGNIVENPIATCELQAYWYVGLRQAALAFFAAGDRVYAFELRAKANRLKHRFNDVFWMEDEGFYGLGLGPDKQLIRSITSNPGHLLAAGIVPRQRAGRVAERLMQPDLFSGWGVRTLSSRHPAYNPFSYHLGSVWPVEQGTFAVGFARYGLWRALHRLTEGVLACSDLFVSGRLPEAIGGLPRDAEHPHPGIYPASNEPQGWSASLIVVLIQAILGMRPFAPLQLVLVDPHLPSWLPYLHLEGIRIGRAVVDIEAWRARGGRTHYRVVGHEGKLRVLRQPPDKSLHGLQAGRVRAAFESLLSG